jgi:hypothetical protein
MNALTLQPLYHPRTLYACLLCSLGLLGCLWQRVNGSRNLPSPFTPDTWLNAISEPQNIEQEISNAEVHPS